MNSRYSMVLKGICISVIGYIIALPQYLCQLESSKNGLQIHNDIVRLIKPPRDVLGATPGSRVQFECLAYSTTNNISTAQDEPLLVAWLKDGKKISINSGGQGTDDSHYFTAQKSSILVVYPVTWQHEGDYRCAILHPNFGVILSRRARLILREMPSFVTTVKSTTIIAGSNVKLSCGATGYPKPVIKWYRNDKYISLDDAEYRERYYILSTGDLKITDFDANLDQGLYFCSAANNVGEILSPKALISTSPTHESSYAVLSGKLPSTEGTIGRNVLTTSSIGRTVYMECIISDDSDVWRSKFPSIYSNYTVHWSRTDPLVFHTTPKPLFKHRNDDAKFLCAVEGGPPPIIKWYKDGEPVKSQGRLKTIPYPEEAERIDFSSVMGKLSYSRDLSLSSFRFEKDVGIYQCFAENSEGEITAAAPLIVLPGSAGGIEHAPSNLRALVSQDESIVKLMWSIPQVALGKSFPPTVYLVHFYATNGSTRSPHDYENTEPALLHEHCLANGTCYYPCCTATPLLPFTFYTFWMTGIDHDSQTSDPTELVVIRTYEATATMIAHPLTATPCRNDKNFSDTSSSCVHLIWKQPDESSIPGLISEYRIEYAEERQSNVFNEIFVEPTINDYEIRNLRPGVSYLFRVTPKTLAGYPNSETLNVRGRSFAFLHYKTQSMVHSLPPPIFVIDIHLENVGRSKSPAYKVIVTAIATSNVVFDKWIRNCWIVFGRLDSIFIEDKTVMDVDWSFNEDKSVIVGRSRSLLKYLPNVFHQATVECDSDVDSTFDFSFARVIHASTFGDINLSTNSVISNQLFATINDLKCFLSVVNTDFSTDSTVNFSVVLNWRIGDISVAGYGIRLWINDKSYREIFIENGTENKLILDDISAKNLSIKFTMRSIFSPDRLSWFTDEKICHFPPDLENFTINMPEKIDVTVLNETTVNVTFVEPQYSNSIVVEHTQDEYLLYKVRYGKNDHFDEVYLPNVEEKSCHRVTLVLENLKPGSSYKLNIAAPDKLGRWGPFSHDCFFQTPLLENRTIFQCYLISGPPPENNFPHLKRLMISFCIVFLCLMVFLTIYWRYSTYSRRNGTTATNSKFCVINLLSRFRDTNNNNSGSKKKSFSSSSDCHRRSSMVRESCGIASVKYCNGTSAEIRKGIDIDKPLLENGNLTTNFHHMQNGALIGEQSSALISEI